MSDVAENTPETAENSSPEVPQTSGSQSVLSDNSIKAENES